MISLALIVIGTLAYWLLSECILAIVEGAGTVSNSRHWAGGSTRAWRKVRQAVLERDQHRCQLQLPGICTTVATCVHHVKGKQFGDSPEFLVAACQACNLHVGEPGRGVPDPDPRPPSWL